ncbi:MAG: TolC family protein [Blastocatellia bacterium]|nr:TolC family protein [Blastocatellia bacterium]
MKLIFRPLFAAFAICLTLGLSQLSVSAQETEEKPQIAQRLDSALKKIRATQAEVETPSVPVASSSVLNRVGTDPSQTQSLSLNDAIRKALENNNSIEVARNDVRFAETQLRSLQGIYDPVITVSPTYSNNVQPQPSTLGGADLSGVTRSNGFTVDSSFNKILKQGGGSYNVFFNNSRNSTSSTFSQLNPTYNTNLGVQYTQPLFRNRGIDGTRRQIKIQRKRLEQSDADFRRQTIEVISQVQRAYWDLVFALRDQQNRTANLNLSKENLRRVEAAIAAGKSAPLERAEVSTELANRESDVLVATQQVSIAENTLKTLLIKEPTSNEWNQAWVPTDAPVFSTDPINVSDAIKDAVDNRPELRRLRLQREINSIDIDYFKNQLKPRIDLTSSFTLIGLAGTSRGANGSIPPQFNGGYGQSLSNLFKTDTRQFTIGATISIPFRNQTAKADLAGAEVQKQQIDAQSRSQEQTIIAEVRNAVQAVETARQRVFAARRARENAEIQLNGERKLYEVGRSTTFLLFQRENALTNARNSEIRAETDYNKALSDLQRATSTTFRLKQHRG